jgi:hypothetical protein
MTNANICLCGAPIAPDAHHCDTCETPKVKEGWKKIAAGEYERDGWQVVKWRNGPPAQWKTYDPDGKLIEMYSFTMAEAKAKAEMEGVK